MGSDFSKYFQELGNKIIGNSFFYFNSVQSTNDEAKRLAEAGEAEGTIIIADTQTKGRGRFNRAWHSAEGKGLWFSVILKPAISLDRVGTVTIFPAVAAAITLKKLYNIHADLKWPNDILIHNLKVGGFLTELKTTGKKINYVISGTGLNINHEKNDFPQELANSATSLYLQTNKKLVLAHVLNELLHTMNELYTSFCANQTDEIFNIWNHFSYDLGKRIIIQEGTIKHYGIFEKINPDGSANIRLNNGKIKRFYSGESTVVGEKS